MVALYEVQRTFVAARKSGDDAWTWESTIWSKATYTLAKQHGKLLPSPARQRFNIDREFGQRLHRAGETLIRKGLGSRRKIRGPEAPAKFAQGYKRHKARDRDYFLTAAGLDQAEQALVAKGLMAAEVASCTELPEPAVLPDLGGCDD